MGDEKHLKKQDEMTAEDEQEMELFLKNSQDFCQRIYGKIYCDEDVETLRKEIKETNEAAKKIKTGWGLA